MRYQQNTIRYVTWSSGMSRMSGILILSDRLKRGQILMFLHWLGTSKNCSYLFNHMSNWDGVWIKMSHFKRTRSLYWKIRFENYRHVTHSPWSCRICIWHLGEVMKIHGFGCMGMGYIISQIDVPPVWLAALIWQRFLNIKSDKRVLIDDSNILSTKKKSLHAGICMNYSTTFSSWQQPSGAQ